MSQNTLNCLGNSIFRNGSMLATFHMSTFLRSGEHFQSRTHIFGFFKDLSIGTDRRWQSIGHDGRNFTAIASKKGGIKSLGTVFERGTVNSVTKP